MIFDFVYFWTGAAGSHKNLFLENIIAKILYRQPCNKDKSFFILHMVLLIGILTYLIKFCLFVIESLSKVESCLKVI